MNEEQIKQRVEKDLPILEARVAKLEDNHIDLKKKLEPLYSVQRRLDLTEAHVEIITDKVKLIESSTQEIKLDLIEFKNNMRNEFNRLIKWVSGIILLSLFSGIIVLFVWGGSSFQNIGIKIGSVEKITSERCGEIEKDIIRLNVKIDTTRSR